VVGNDRPAERVAWVRGSLLWAKRSASDPGVTAVVRRRLGNAVARNRIKRRLRRIAATSPLESVGIVLLPQKAAMSAVYSDLMAEYERLLTQLAAQDPQ